MSRPAAKFRYIGQPIRRDEDYRFLRGRGRFTEDLVFPGAAHAAFVRSPHANARIVHIDTEAAAAMPGVLRVITGEDWRAAGFSDLPCISSLPSSDGSAMLEARRPVLATGAVRHVGDTVAAVIARTETQARDAAELVDVEYEPGPAVTHPLTACDPTAPLVHEHFGTNVAHTVEYGDRAATDAAFARAAHITEIEYHHQRVAVVPIENRAYIGAYDNADHRYTLSGTGQNPHLLRRMYARDVLGIPEHRLRVINPDVGGGFGTKYFGYSEAAVVLAAAKLVGRPVRWVSTRSEALLTDTQARDVHIKAALALDANARMLAIRCESTGSYGAYQSTFAPVIIMTTVAETTTGLYRIPAAHVVARGVFTHATPIDAFRGTKQVPAQVHEQLVAKAGLELGIDAAELRLRNYLDPSDYPYATPVGRLYDSGFPALQHDTLSDVVDYAALRAHCDARRERGALVGLGVSAFTESGGYGPSRQMIAMGASLGGWESARVHVHEDGKVTLFVGTHSHGQGHETTFRQIAADGLGLDIADVTLTQGDSDAGPGNLGTMGGRALSTAGMGLVESARRVIEKMTRLAAHLMECADEDVEYHDGEFVVAGTNRLMRFADVSAAAYTGADYPEEGFDLGLEETVRFDPSHTNFATALHVVVAEVDRDTGRVTLDAFYSVDDCGRVVNPMVVTGQVHGGIVQGIGQAITEQVVYEDGTGQLLSGSLLDYTLPRADDVPDIRTAFQETLNPNNALGSKTGSEAGIVGAAAAVSNAVLDALWPIGVRDLQMPLTSERVWQTMREAQG